MSAISTLNIDDTKPVFVRPMTQSTRDNFTEIKKQFDNAKSDIDRIDSGARNAKWYGADGVTDDNAAITTAFATGNSVVISDQLLLETNLTLTDADIVFTNGGGISIDSGITLTLAGSSKISAGNYQIFSGSGTVSGYNYIGNPYWFGGTFDGSTDDYTAINDCMTATNGVQLPPTSGVISAQINVPNDKALLGSRGAGTLSKLTTHSTFPTSTAMVDMGTKGAAGFGVNVEDIYLDANHITGVGGIVNGIAQEGSTIKNVSVYNFGGVGIEIKSGTGASAGNFVVDNLWLAQSKEASTKDTRCLKLVGGQRSGTKIGRVTLAVSLQGTNTWNVKPNFMAEIAAGQFQIEHANVEGGADVQIASIFVYSNANVTLTNMHFTDDPAVAIYAHPGGIVDGTSYTAAKAVTMTALTNRDQLTGVTIYDGLNSGRNVTDTDVAFYSTQDARPSLTGKVASTVDGTYGTEEQNVINNNRTRIEELETVLKNLGLID